MPRYVTTALLLLLLLGIPLLAQDDPKAALKEKLAKAQAELDEAEYLLDEVYKELEHDFQLVRGDKWERCAERFEMVIEDQVALLREDAEYDLLEGLIEGFYEISLVSEVTFVRLAKAIEKPVREAAKGEEEIPTAAIIAAGVKAVFPEEKFEDCWDKHFMDLEAIAAYDEAEKAFEKAKAAVEAPFRPTIPECDGPKGTVYVPKGRFVYGPWTGWDFDLEKNEAGQARSDGFYIGAFEVTNEEFRLFLKDLGDTKRKREYLPNDFRMGKRGRIQIPEGSESLPVTGLTFAAAAAYAESVGMRLPTEEEWEYAARGAKGNQYPWGAEFEKDAANSKERGLGKKSDVGSHPRDKSPFGAYDMAGNVAEMTSMLAGRKPARGKFDSSVNIICRGGSFQDDKAALLTSYRWTIAAAAGRSDNVGFRCVVSEKDWKAKKK